MGPHAFWKTDLAGDEEISDVVRTSSRMRAFRR